MTTCNGFKTISILYPVTADKIAGSQVSSFHFPRENVILPAITGIMVRGSTCLKVIGKIFLSISLLTCWLGKITSVSPLFPLFQSFFAFGKSFSPGAVLDNGCHVGIKKAPWKCLCVLGIAHPFFFSDLSTVAQPFFSLSQFEGALSGHPQTTPMPQVVCCYKLPCSPRQDPL